MRLVVVLFKFPAELSVIGHGGAHTALDSDAAAATHLDPIIQVFLHQVQLNE